MGEIILLVVLIVLLVAMFVISYMRKRKYNQSLSSMRDELKIGDKVMTDSGIVGEVVDSYTEEEYKYFVLKSGRGANVGYYTVHGNAIYYVFGKDEPNKTTKKAENVVVETPETVENQEAVKAEKTAQSKSKKGKSKKSK